ncbi:hypothetical protein WA026_020801 [Henosepilachna vigintioctopunctata]|uniref:Protein-tyrosine-phosphatase n=1 Tax=Henosepilachna vigintioctopunctata TaxID=420089 RepID=A0AAW1TXE8_9CUCU
MTKMKLEGCVLRNIFVLILFTLNFSKLFEETSASEIKKEWDYSYDSSSETPEKFENATQKSEIEENFTQRSKDWRSLHSTNFDDYTSFHENDIISTTPSTPEDSQSFSMGIWEEGLPTQKFNDTTQNIFPDSFPTTRKETSETSINSSEFSNPDSLEILHRAERASTTVLKRPDNSEKYTNILSAGNKISTTDANVHETSSLQTTEIPSIVLPKRTDNSEKYTNILSTGNEIPFTDANLHETSSLQITEIPSTTVSNRADNSEKYTNVLSTGNKISTTDANVHETSSLQITEILSTVLPNRADNSEKYTNILSTGSEIPFTNANVHETSSLQITEIASTTVSNTQNNTISSTIIFDVTPISIKSNEETFGDIWNITTEKFDDTTQNNFHKTTSSPAETSPENVFKFTTDFSDIYTKILSPENTVVPTDIDENDTTTVTSETTTENLVPPEIDFVITNVSSYNFTIEWKEPFNFTEYNIMYYYISVKDKGPKHYVRPLDVIRHERDYKYSNNESKFLTHEAAPNSLYEIQVFAGDEYQNGTSEIKNITTNSSYSTEPLSVTSDVEVISNHCNKTKYRTTLHLNWELPHNTNGDLDHFLVEISGSNYNEKFTVPAASNIREAFYDLNVSNLNASSEYNYTISPITVGNIKGFDEIGYDKTPDGCPSEPTRLAIHEITTSGFGITWKEAEEYYGVILEYDVEINILGHNHFTSYDTECRNKSRNMFNYSTKRTFFKFIEGLPHYKYIVSTRSRTSAGRSEFSEYKTVTTASIASTPVRDLIVFKSGYKITEDTFEYNVTLSFKKPCNTNGPFESYLIKYSGYREDYPNADFTKASNNLSETNIGITLKNAEYDYTFEVFVVTEHNYTSVAKNGHIKTISGVPPANPEEINYKINEENPIQIDVVLKKNTFNNSMGNIIYYAVILIRSNGSVHPRKLHHDEWGEYWPSANNTTFYFRKRSEIIQLTENYWNPFNDSVNTINICIGKSSECSLNYELSEETDYFIVIRGLTKNTYRDIYTLIKTGKYESNLWLTLTLIFFFLLLIVCAIYVYSKKGQSIRIKFKRISNANGIEGAPRHIIAIKNITSYYNKIADDPEILKQQYADLEDETRAYKEKNVKSDFALKPENKRKNRYINILPYDENRVRLNIEEDDEISSDYINASYIRGFSGEIEYIASQGPLEHTCRDFWKMVIQENVTVIVMVSHFVENEKEKCFKYFPRNYENLLICEDLEVKCLTELQFDTYCVRTLLVRKDIRQYSVVHLQYIDWPDFGCPSGTSNMLFFCQEVRDRIKLEMGKMIVHCSAGVGRTGTLISLDILLQAVRKKKEISIFETVLQLRKQRTHMVQTEVLPML